MRFVRCSTTSGYEAMFLSPEQARGRGSGYQQILAQRSGPDFPDCRSRERDLRASLRVAIQSSFSEDSTYPNRNYSSVRHGIQRLDLRRPNRACRAS